MNVEAGIISGLVVLALAAFGTWLRRRMLIPLRQTSLRAARRTTRGVSSRAQAMWLNWRISVARRKGMSVVARVRRGPEYATITWRGAVEIDTYRFRDLPTYRRVQQTDRRTMPTRTSCCGRPPRVGHRQKLAV